MTNIIFIIPIPPTTRDKRVIKNPVPPIAIFSLLYWVSKAFVWLIAKSLFSLGLNPLICLITPDISSSPSSILSSGTLTLKRIHPLLEKILLYAPNGKIACLSTLKRPRNFPCFSKTPTTLNFKLSILIYLPIASSSPKKASFIPPPIIVTLAPTLSSLAVKNLPRSISVLMVSMYSSFVPNISVLVSLSS